MAGPYRMKRVQEPAPYRWQRQQQATGTTKAGASPVRRSQLPEDADFTTKLAALRHSVESRGLKWNGPISRGMALELILFGSHEVNREFKSLVEIIEKQQKQIAGMQAKVDHHEKHLMKFAGDFQPALTYHEGALIRSKGKLYLAMKTIAAGKGDPGREGSGWVCVI